MTSPITFPRQYARTQRFTLGAPRSFSVAPDGSRIAFLRSRSGTDRAQLLWVADIDGDRIRAERPAADAVELLAGAGEELSAEERARRERSRESAAGIVGYATDGAVELAAFALSGRLFTAELRAGTTRELVVPGPVVDPRPSPDGRLVAYAAGGALRVVGADGGGDLALAEPEGAGGAWGVAEFIAAEEMERSRGFWWSPESDRLLAAHVDDSPVQRWWIADPAHPGSAPAQVAYPAAGTANAVVTLALLGLDGSRVPVEWDRERFPYLARVHWSTGGPPLILVQARDQHSQLILSVDVETGRTETVRAEQDPVWLELCPGVPVWAPDGRLVRIGDERGARVLAVGDQVLTDDSAHVRAVLDVGGDGVVFLASEGEAALRGADGGGPVDTVRVHLARQDSSTGRWTSGLLAADTEAGAAASAVCGGGVAVLSRVSVHRPGTAVEVVRYGGGGQPGGVRSLGTIASYAETPVLTAAPALVRASERSVPAAVLLPTGYPRDGAPLPVLLDPYGGPHFRRVVGAQNAYLVSQWFAEQGFAVVVADGRGTPGRSPAWEKSVAGDLAGVTVADQVAAVQALAGRFPLDLGRVAVRGWSFGGYLAGLAVLRRPDVFHAAVVGAPCTDMRLYDTHYTERYLGHPDQAPQVYAENSLVTDEGLSGAAEPARPMLIIHGLADDNVVVAHSLRLSSALLAAGRPHEVLPLSGVTHMTPQEQVAENLLLLQVDFLRRSLGLARAGADRAAAAVR